MGEIVIVATEPDQSKWSLDRVVELVRGTDGAIREVLVNSAGNLSHKAINKLIPLKLGYDPRRDETFNEEDVPEVMDDEAEGVETSTRPKRRTATVVEDLMKSLI